MYVNIGKMTGRALKELKSSIYSKGYRTPTIDCRCLKRNFGGDGVEVGMRIDSLTVRRVHVQDGTN